MSRLVVAIGHVEFTGGSQVLYVVKVQQDADEWEVRRTYSDFRKLRDDVQRVMKDARAHILDDACSRDFARELQELPFPAKRLFGSRKDHVVKERAVELHRFLIKLLFLTHTYRKAQKARYDQYVQALPSHQQAAYAALQDRTQASVSVFYLLRDFLKPVTIKTDVPPHSGDLLGSASDGAFPGANEQRESSPKRLIRESKILAMRSSNASERKQQQQSSKEAMRENDKMQQHQRREQQVEKMRHEQHKQQQQQRKKSEAADPALDSSVAASSAGNNSSKTVRMNDLMAASERSRAEASSLRQQFLQKQHSASVAEESLRDQFLQKQKSTSALENEHRMQRHYSTPDGHAAIMKNRTARAATSTSALSSVASSSHDESEPEKEKHVASPSVPSSTSSTASGDEVKLVDLSSLAQYKTKKTSPRRDSHSSDRSKSSHKSSTTEKKEKKEKSSTRTKEKKTSRIKRKAKSAKNIQMTDSERMSRVSSALNAQAISINAQRELEKYISEYSAIMILRYVDRFINKAVMKAPGCYRVNAQHRLVIDSQRFLQELEDTFTDLPSNFGDLFQTDHDELAFPPALDRYVQLKWDSFQSMGSSNSISHDNGHSSAADQTSDSDDSDTEYEYEEVGGGGYMTAKQTFSNDEESMLQEMIANGTAGREQMLRLRRQINEQGWNRRENPGSRSQRVIEEASSSESDDEEALSRLREKRRSKRREPKRSVSCVVEKYQQEQNARRKDRLQSFGGPIGGFV